MPRRWKWDAAKYAETAKALRPLAYGFDKKDGFDLRNVESWTAKQREKVRRMFNQVWALQAQPKRPLRARGENLKRMQKVFHGSVSPSLKVVFVPDTEPQLSLPGAKQRPPRIRELKDGYVISRRGQYDRVFIPFNQKALIKNARAEIKRIADQIPGAKLWYAAVDENTTLSGATLSGITSTILKWMEQYDGVKELPQTSGNRGDNPESHHWRRWLNGLVALVLAPGMSVKSMVQAIERGRARNKAMRQEINKRMKRKGRYGKPSTNPR